jgi:ferredoxin/flavodoxin
MKCLICYYSATGNTKLACDYIAANIPAIDCAFFNIASGSIPDIDEFTVIGFGCFADFLGPSTMFREFVEKLPAQKGKPAFAFNTFGNFNGRTLKIMVDGINRKGFQIFAAHALHMPENIPTMTTTFLANRQAPGKKELASFKKFVSLLHAQMSILTQDGTIARHYRHSLFDYIMPTLPRKMGKKAMGNKSVDKALCTLCQLCVRICPRKAISMKNNTVQFDENACEACWACYNNCPAKAIYTKQFRGRGHYPKPLDILSEKLPLRA